MSSPQLSPEQREEADKIFKRGLWTGWFLAFGVLMLLTVIIIFVSRGVFHAKGSGGWIGSLTVLVGVFTNAFATRQVRSAGLSLDHVESHSILRTATHFQGEPIALHSPHSEWLGILGLVLSCVMLFGLWSLQKSVEPFSPFFAAICLVLVIAMCLGALYLMTDPAALLIDSQGIQGSKNGFWSHHVSWEKVATMEIRDAFNYKGALQLKTLIFRDHANAILIKVPLSSFTVKTDQIDSLVAQIEAKLSGDSQEGVL